MTKEVGVDEERLEGGPSGPARDGRGFLGRMADALGELLSSGPYAAFASAVIGCIPLAALSVYPLVIPGQFVISPPSLLKTAACLLLVALSSVASTRLVRRVPAPLAMLTCALVPSTALLVGILWCVPTFAIVAALSLGGGLVAWAIGRRHGRRNVATTACVILVSLSLGLLAMLPIGDALCLERPELFASGRSRVSRQEGEGIHGEVAQALAAAAREAGAIHGCDEVVVSPFRTGIDGRLLSWDKAPGGEVVLFVASEYLTGYDTSELVDRARDLMSQEGDAASLYTRWLDGELWTVLQGL